MKCRKPHTWRNILLIRLKGKLDKILIAIKYLNQFHIKPIEGYNIDLKE